MRTFESSLLLDAPAITVWREVANVTAWPQFMTTFTRVEALDGPELELGRRFKSIQPKLRPALWIVTRLTPGESFTWESRMPGILMTAHHAVVPGADGTMLRLEFCFDGLLAPVIAKLWGKLTREYLQRECAAVRDRVQGTAPPSLTAVAK